MCGPGFAGVQAICHMASKQCPSGMPREACQPRSEVPGPGAARAEDLPRETSAAKLGPLVLSIALSWRSSLQQQLCSCAPASKRRQSPSTRSKGGSGEYEA